MNNLWYYIMYSLWGSSRISEIKKQSKLEKIQTILEEDERGNKENVDIAENEEVKK